MRRQRPTDQQRFVRVLSPLRDFLAAEAAGGVLLAVGAAAALVWANSPWSASYEELWSNSLAISFDGHTLELDVRHWINDGLMTVFFFVVGLEIKRELSSGHLATRRAAMLPITAAIGGMVVPALIYLAIAGGSAPRGWAIPMATDIALAVGVLAIAGSRVAASMRAFLLGLAIVDDIGAIVVIAAFYSTGLAWGWLAAAVAGVGTTMIARLFDVRHTSLYVAIGVFTWFALHEGGVHATLAGVAMGLLAPTTARVPPELVDTDDLTDLSSVEAARVSTDIARNSVSVVEWLQHVLHPWTSYVIVPVFALANAGIVISRDELDDALTSKITWGIVAGLVVGKPLGILLARHLAIRSGFGSAPDGTPRQQLVGVGTAAGIGFTVALFITELAFTDPAQQADGKLAVLVASLIAAILSIVLLCVGGRKPTAKADETRLMSPVDG